MVTTIASTAITRHLFFARTVNKSVVCFPWLRQLAQWLCDHWHIAADTAQHANEFYKPSHSKVRQIWKTGFYID
jgi:hypothetical protein